MFLTPSPTKHVFGLSRPFLLKPPPLPFPTRREDSLSSPAHGAGALSTPNFSDAAYLRVWARSCYSDFEIPDTKYVVQMSMFALRLFQQDLKH